MMLSVYAVFKVRPVMKLPCRNKEVLPSEERQVFLSSEAAKKN